MSKNLKVLRIPTDGSPGTFTDVPCWNDEDARELILRILEKLGLDYKDIIRGEKSWAYKLAISVSA